MITLEGLSLIEIDKALYRNIVSIRDSQDLYDDLSDDEADWELAAATELAHKPMFYQSSQPIIDRPFEDAALLQAIEFPFAHFSESRFSAGYFGVWYGSETLETTIFETTYHWYHGLLSDAGFQNLEGVIGERRVHTVECKGALVNLIPKQEDWIFLRDNNYIHCQQLGERLHREGFPGLWTLSARHQGNNAAVLKRDILSGGRIHCYLTYHFHAGKIHVYRDREHASILELDPNQSL